FAGMDWFDALNHTFATVATGGFSTRNASIAAFPSPVIQWIIIVFMFLAGINFALHYHFLCGRGSIYYKDKECVSYTALLGGGSAIIAVTLVVAGLFSANTLAELEHVVRASVFQLVSLCTTTGFVSENYSSWPPLVLCIFLFFMFMGGCAGSTSGGIKTMRFAILMRMAYQEIFRLLHPHSVRHIKLGGRTIFPEVISGVIGFLLLYMIVLTLCTALLTTQDMDLLSAFTASLTCLSNVGPGLGSVGPVDNFDHLTTLAKWLLTLCMLLGRLEIYAIIVLFVPEFWRK
ncbi:MAG: potassium transporter TrkG, partial [Bilophila sp.]